MHSAGKRGWKNKANSPPPVSSSPGADWVRLARLRYSVCGGMVPAGQMVQRPRAGVMSLLRRQELAVASTLRLRGWRFLSGIPPAPAI